jgi:hypothetical protein
MIYLIARRGQILGSLVAALKKPGMDFHIARTRQMSRFPSSLKQDLMHSKGQARLRTWDSLHFGGCSEFLSKKSGWKKMFDDSRAGCSEESS